MSEQRTGTVRFFLALWLAVGVIDSDLPSTSAAPPAKHTASTILGNPDCVAFSYGGYRKNSRAVEPTTAQLKEDVRILSALGVKMLRTYNTQQFGQAATLLEAIRELKGENPALEMYVMLGAWIDCEGAWTDDRNHEAGNVENNADEIEAAVAMANEYPEIVKVIAVGNEAMVHWATQYYVHPRVILKWVNHLQEMKSAGDLDADLWVTSSDNYASWGGGGAEYHNEDLASLIRAVDFVSLHTYPFHETHYAPEFWGGREEETDRSPLERAHTAMRRAQAHAVTQYQSAADYIQTLGIDKPIHIGETGWASVSGASYGADGSQAADEYKAKLFYDGMREWTNKAGMSCFYFEAFDECWKDLGSPNGSENHFGLITRNGQAKYALWEQVDAGVFDGLTRDGQAITKTFGGDEAALKASLLPVPLLSEMGSLVLTTVNAERQTGQAVTQARYVIAHDSLIPTATNDLTYPSAPVTLNTWEGTCSMEMSKEGVIHVETGRIADGWWGCGLEVQSDGTGEDLSLFKSGQLHFDIRGDTASPFQLGFQSGKFAAGDQVNNYVTMGPKSKYRLTEKWKTYSVGVAELNKGANFSDVTGLVYLHGENGGDGKSVELRNIYYSRE